MNFTQIRSTATKMYNRYKIKSYKIYKILKEHILESGKKRVRQKSISIKDSIPKSRTEFHELIDTGKHKIVNFPKRYERPIPEASGDLDIVFDNKWSEEVNVNNSEELYFLAPYKKMIDTNGTVYTVSIICTKNKSDIKLKRDYLDLYDESKNVEREYHKETVYDLYIDIDVVHTNESDEIKHELTTTKTGRILKQAQGIRELESKINSLMNKYDENNIETMIEDLQERDEIYRD